MSDAAMKKLVQSAAAALAQQRYAEAMETSQRVLLFRSDDVNALVLLGKASFALKKFEESERALKRAVELCPSHIVACKALADVYSATNDHARRELLAESLATQLEQAKKIKGFQNWTYQTAQSAICAGNHANALRAFDRLLTDPFSIVSVLNAELPSPISIVDCIVDLIEAHDELKIKASRAQYLLTLLREEDSRCVDTLFRILLDTLVHGKKEEKENLRRELDAIAMKWSAFVALPLQYLLLRSEDQDFAMTEPQLQALILNGKSLHSEAPMFLIVQALQSSDSDLEQVLSRASAFPESKYYISAQEALLWQSALSQDAKRIQNCLESIQKSVYDKHQALGSTVRSSIYSDKKDLYFRGQCASIAKDYNRALQLFQSAFASPETDTKITIAAAIHIAELYIQRDKAGKAMETVELALVTVDSPLLQCTRGYCLHLLGQTELARGVYELALTQLPLSLSSVERAKQHKRLGMIYYALGAQFRSLPGFCLEQWLRSAKLNCNDAHLFYLIGNWYLELKNDHVRAEKCFTRALSLSPAYELAIEALIALYDATDQVQAKIALYERLIQHKETAPTYALLALAEYYLQTQDERAVTMAHDLVRLEPESARNWALLAHLYAFFGKLVSSQRAYMRCFALGADAVCLHLELARIETELYQYSQALDRLQLLHNRFESLTLHDQKALSVRYAEALLFQAQQFCEQGFYGRAATNIQSASRILESNRLKAHGMTKKLLADVHLFAFFLAPTDFGNAWLTFIAKGGEIYGEIADSDRSSVDALVGIGTSAYYEFAALCSMEMIENPALRLYLAKDTSSFERVRALAKRGLQAFRSALEIDANNALAWNGYAVFHRNTIVKQFAWTRAIEIASLPASYANLAIFYATIAQDNACLAAHARALSRYTLTQLQKWHPNHAFIWIGIGMLASLENADPIKAIEAYACALRSHSDLNALLNASVANLSLKTPHFPLSDTLFWLRKFVERDPFHAIAYNALGVALYRLRVYNESFKAFEKAQAIESKRLKPNQSDFLALVTGNARVAAFRAGMEREDGIACVYRLVREKRFDSALLCIRNTRSEQRISKILAGLMTILVLSMVDKAKEAMLGLRALLFDDAYGDSGPLIGEISTAVLLYGYKRWKSWDSELTERALRLLPSKSEVLRERKAEFDAITHLCALEKGERLELEAMDSDLAARIGMYALLRQDFEGFEIARLALSRIGRDETDMPIFVVFLRALLRVLNVESSGKEGLKVLRAYPMEAFGYAIAVCECLKERVKESDDRAIRKLISQGRMCAEGAGVKDCFELFEAVLDGESDSRERFGSVQFCETEKALFQIRLQAILDPAKALKGYTGILTGKNRCSIGIRRLPSVLIELAALYERLSDVHSAIRVWRMLLKSAESLVMVQPKVFRFACHVRLAFLFVCRLKKQKIGKAHLESALGEAVQDAMHTGILEVIKVRLEIDM